MGGRRVAAEAAALAEDAAALAEDAAAAAPVAAAAAAVDTAATAVTDDAAFCTDDGVESILGGMVVVDWATKIVVVVTCCGVVTGGIVV